MGDFLATWGWVVWIGLILVFVIIEMFSLEFTFLMLALGGLFGLVSGLFGVPFWVQIIIAGVAAVALLFGVRPPLLRRLKRGSDPTPTNLEALLGLTGTVVKLFADGSGQARLSNGETWTSRLSATSDGPLVEGEKVVVTAIEGATAVVVPAERTAL